MLIVKQIRFLFTLPNNDSPPTHNPTRAAHNEQYRVHSLVPWPLRARHNFKPALGGRSLSDQNPLFAFISKYIHIVLELQSMLAGAPLENALFVMWCGCVCVYECDTHSTLALHSDWVVAIKQVNITYIEHLFRSAPLAGGANRGSCQHMGFKFKCKTYVREIAIRKNQLKDVL